MQPHLDEKKTFQILIAQVSAKPRLQSISGSVLVYTSTVEETISAINNQVFNLIIIELELDAINLISLIKAPDGINKFTPTIGLLENDDAEQRKKLILGGFDDCLLHPITDLTIVEVINIWRNDSDAIQIHRAIETFLLNCRNNQVLALNIYQKLLDELPKQIGQIEAALNSEQYDLAFNVTHCLNGCVRVCYLEQIELLANALEKNIRKKNFDYANGYFLMLRQKIDTLIRHRQTIVEFIQNR